MSTDQAVPQSNGSARPYRDGDRWKHRVNTRLPNGKTVHDYWQRTDPARKQCSAQSRTLQPRLRTPPHRSTATSRTAGGWCQHWLTTSR